MENKAEQLLRRYNRARERRAVWESHWRECYDFALPQRDGALVETISGEKKTDNLFDATAPNAVDQLAASLLAHLTPPWARWFGLAPGGDLGAEEKDQAGVLLDRTAEIIRSHFDRSNFSMEMHQCYLDLVTVGTACLLFEEAAPGEPSAFRFSAVPLSEVVLDEGPNGRPDITFRRSQMTMASLKARFSDGSFPDEMERKAKDDPDRRFVLIESVLPEDHAYAYTAFLEEETDSDGGPLVLREGRFAVSPFINFRWLKAPGETYGRSPVMKTLPDIKTVNKVVELLLKNATIAVTGIWQADDDGVLNPATIRLVPGAIIPKAVGSSGLTPLASPGNFDTSQLVLAELRGNIRSALLADKLGQTSEPRMTATEVMERSAEMARILGATYGRLQSELLTPLIMRAIGILRRRGEVEALRIDGRTVDLQYRSPLALDQARQDAQATMNWVSTISGLGPDGMAQVNTSGVARWLARTMGVPTEMMNQMDDGDPLAQGIAALSDFDFSKVTPDMLNKFAEKATSLLSTETSLKEITPAPPIKTPFEDGKIKEPKNGQ